MGRGHGLGVIFLLFTSLYHGSPPSIMQFILNSKRNMKKKPATMLMRYTFVICIPLPFIYIYIYIQHARTHENILCNYFCTPAFIKTNIHHMPCTFRVSSTLLRKSLKENLMLQSRVQGKRRVLSPFPNKLPMVRSSTKVDMHTPTPTHIL